MKNKKTIKNIEKGKKNFINTIDILLYITYTNINRTSHAS